MSAVNAEEAEDAAPVGSLNAECASDTAATSDVSEAPGGSLDAEVRRLLDHAGLARVVEELRAEVLRLRHENDRADAMHKRGKPLGAAASALDALLEVGNTLLGAVDAGETPLEDARRALRRKRIELGGAGDLAGEQRRNAKAAEAHRLRQQHHRDKAKSVTK
jgi:hypothetical protein